MINLKDKDTVIFDFGDTLASTVPTYPDRIKIALQNIGFEISDKDFFDSYQFADYQIYNNYIKTGTVNSSIYQNSLFDILKGRLKIETDQKELKKLVKIQLNKIEYRRELLDYTGEFLEKLKSRGFRLAIISNNDGFTSEKCRELGIDKYFEIVVDSTNVGMVKPDRDIYRYTLEKLNIDADKAVHIGDLYGADILGGINSGLNVIWFNHRNGENYDKLDIKQFQSLKDILETV